MGFTDNQKLAIDSRGNDVLVSAAAGSGKTTVLVERIIRRIMDEKDPIDIDRILVLTFTNAAAANMREKILKEIEKKIAVDPMNSHLSRQAMLVQNAQISTFHSFCQKIIGDHFYEINSDPQLRTIDETEGKLMRIDALERVMEAAYEEADDDFIRLVESYAGKKSDSGLDEMIEKLYNSSQAHPYPDEWLDICEKSYDAKSVEELTETEWFKSMVLDMKAKIGTAFSYASELVRICGEPGGPFKYSEAAESDLDFVSRLSVLDDYEDIIMTIRSHNKKTLSQIRKTDGVDEELKAEFGQKRSTVYKLIEGISKATAGTLEDEVGRMAEIAPVVKKLIALVRDFEREYSSLKADNGVMDFNDMEHLAIKALRCGEGVIAEEYRDRFVEIYVDEYQDSNLTQEEIISLIGRGVDGRCGNVFMVGDVKQSIYRFRNARPDLFRGKYKSFSHMPENGEGQVIDLSDNFRSRHEVLDAANEIFEGIMHSEVGGIEYDSAARLNYGHLYDEHITESDYRAELILAVRSEELNPTETEAYAIAQKIEELVGKFDVVGKDGQIRKAEYSDIVILLRGMKGKDTIYKDVLTKRGIPVLVTTGVGYFSAYEIETIMSFLAVVDNPLQDIPLAAVLRSPLADFDDNDLAVIRSRYRKIFLYEAVVKYYEEESTANGEAGTDTLTVKIGDFLRLLEHYRDEAEYLSVYEILREIIDGSFGDYLRSGRNGRQAEANLNMLLQKALDFGKLSYKGLFHFLRYIDQMKKYEVDYGEAGMTDETAQNVRIMTIHKSKGLEFPIVFVGWLDKERNISDETGDMVVDPDLGIGLKYVNVENRTKRSTMLQSYIKGNLARENLAEEIRVLYVALTRAQEKLFMVGTVKDVDKEFYNVDKPIADCNKYIQLLSRVYHDNDGFDNIITSVIKPEDLVMAEVARTLSIEDAYYRLKGLVNKGNDKTQDGGRFAASLDFEYPFAGDFPKYAKTSVSELKKLSMEASTDGEDAYEPTTADYGETMAAITGRDETAATTTGNDATVFASASKRESVKAYVPGFIREDEEAPNAGTFYGTAFHKMLELWDYSISCGRENEVTTEEIDEFFEKMQSLGKIDAIQIEAVKSCEIQTFIRSDIAIRMGRADAEKKLYREQPFVLGVDPGMMLVQGIIDAYWIEDDGIVILDYKTDRVKAGSELIEKYHVQLEYYRDALERLTDLKVKNMIIYSARLRETIEL